MRIIVITSRWEKVVDDWLVGKNLHRLTRIGHSTVSSSHAGSTSIYLNRVRRTTKQKNIPLHFSVFSKRGKTIRLLTFDIRNSFDTDKHSISLLLSSKTGLIQTLAYSIVRTATCQQPIRLKKPNRADHRVRNAKERLKRANYASVCIPNLMIKK